MFWLIAHGRARRRALSINRQQPTKSNAELLLVELSHYFFWCRQLLIAGHMLCCRHEILCVECRDTHWVKALCLRLYAQLETYQRIDTHCFNSAP